MCSHWGPVTAAGNSERGRFGQSVVRPLVRLRQSSTSWGPHTFLDDTPITPSLLSHYTLPPILFHSFLAFSPAVPGPPLNAIFPPLLSKQCSSNWLPSHYVTLRLASNCESPCLSFLSSRMIGPSYHTWPNPTVFKPWAQPPGKRSG